MNNSLGAYKIRGIFELLRVYKSKSRANQSDSSVVIVATKPQTRGNVFMGNVQLARLRFGRHAFCSNGMGNNKNSPILRSSPKPPYRSSSPRQGLFPMWLIILNDVDRVKLFLGSLFSLLLAVKIPNWTTLLKLGGKVDIAIKNAEQLSEVVEKVAGVVDKVAEEVASSLPDGNKIKEVATMIDHISKEATKDAQLTDEILHKLEVVEQDLEDVEKIVEPIIDKIERDSKQEVKS